MNIQHFIIVTFKIWREGSSFVSKCEELGVASCGDTVEAAFEAVRDATELYLNTLEEEGEIERVFAERGVSVRYLPAHAPAPEMPMTVRAKEPEYVRSHRFPLAQLEA